MQKVFIRVGETDQEARRIAGESGAQILADYGDRLLVRATAKALRGLTDAGLSWEAAESLDRIVVGETVIDTVRPRRPRGAVRPRGAREPEVRYWLLQFVGPMLPVWVDAVRGAGGEVVGPVPENAVVVRMKPEQAAAAEALPFVQWVGPYEAQYKLGPGLEAEPVAAPRGSIRRGRRREPELLPLVLTLFDPSALSAVVSEVERLGGVVRRADGEAIVCEVPAGAVAALAALPAVALVRRYHPPTLFLDVARGITGAQFAFDAHGLDGQGETVAVADTGLDVGNDGPTLHQDFKNLDGTNGRVVGYPLGRATPPRRWDDPDGHGTHVAGITAGNGRQTANRANTGVAFKARIAMQSTLDAGGGLGGIPASLATLFGPVYEGDGARVHNNSWGISADYCRYVDEARQVDRFVWEHPDLVIVFAAGNDGHDRDGDGVVNFLTMSPYATFRNGLAVGATENNKGAIAATYGGTWPVDYPAPPLNNDPLSDNPEQMAAFSGRGPALVRLPPPAAAPAGFPAGFGPDRVKPDIVAPGVSILAPFSSRWTTATDPQFANNTTTYGPFVAGSGYVYMGGTSMAAPHVAGLCALVRQWLRRVHRLSDPDNADLRRRRPSAALVKALLVHGARRVRGAYAGFPAVDNCGTAPGNHQGWGRADLRCTLFSHPVGAQVSAADADWLPRRTIFVDSPDRTLNGLPAADPTSRRSHEVRVRVADRSVPLRATLVWTDFPGAVNHPGSVVNRLSLTVVRGAAVTVPVAPVGLLPAPAPAPLSNNVQQVDVQNPELDEYVLRVEATAPLPSVAVAGTAQDFSLVISGALSHSDHRNPGTLAGLPDLAFLDLQPTGAGVARHDGLAPSPERPPGDEGSADIWLAREADPSDAAQAEHAQVGGRNYVYVRVRNLGFAAANGARVRLFWADADPPPAWPSGWHADGFRVEGASGNQRTLDVPARTRVGAAWRDGEAVAGPFEWSPPRGRERVLLLARAEHDDDPVVTEGDLRWDNNLTCREVVVQDATTEVTGEPSGWDRFLFWLVSGFGSPRTVEARFVLTYIDLADGQEKPVPPGVEVQVLDYDPVTGDDVVATTAAASSHDGQGRSMTVVNLAFSTVESGERAPDLYVRVPRPTGGEFAGFVASSLFRDGREAWSSREVPASQGGFYVEDFEGDRIGLPDPMRLVLRPTGIHVRASFEGFRLAEHEFEPFPAGILVKVMDAKPDAPRPLLATAATDARGAISAVVPRTEGYSPSLYFLIERDPAVAAFASVGYFGAEARWDSRTKQAEVVAANGTAAARDGLFADWTCDELVTSSERLRFRLESPGVQVRLRFQYFDREAGQQVDLPEGVEVELWEEAAGAASPLVTETVGSGGLLQASVPKGGRERIDFYARVLMRRRLSAPVDVPVRPTAEVRKAGAVVRWDSRGRTAADGVTSGSFAGVQTRVPAAGDPPTFQIGTGAADPNDEHAAPFILKVVGEIHDWLRLRTGGDWTGQLGIRAELAAGGAANGSTFDGPNQTVRLNTAHGGATRDHWNRSVIAHHVGHLVLEARYLVAGRAAPGVPDHHAYNPRAEQPNQQRRVLAEAWADFVAQRHPSGATPPDPSPRRTYWRGFDNNGANNSGEVVPAAVANTLWLLDEEVVGRGTTGPADPRNQRRFRALLWGPVGALPGEEARQTPYELYRAVQSAPLAAEDLIPDHDEAYVRQEVRRVFESNGLILTRGRITAANQLTAQSLGGPNPRSETWRVRVEPADRAKLNVAQMGRIAAYRIQARRSGTLEFVELDPVVDAAADQKAQVDVNFTAARQTNLLPGAGSYHLRVQARDEFGAWDTFAEDFTGNAGTYDTNDKWQRDRLGSLRGAAVNVP